MATRKKPTIESETRRLGKLFREIPKNQLELVRGLIDQAARLTVMLWELSEDIQENGMTEWFQQSEKSEPYMRKRPAAELFATYDKNFSVVMKQLQELLPPEAEAADDLAIFRSAR